MKWKFIWHSRAAHGWDTWGNRPWSVIIVLVLQKNTDPHLEHCMHILQAK